MQKLDPKDNLRLRTRVTLALHRMPDLTSARLLQFLGPTPTPSPSPSPSPSPGGDPPGSHPTPGLELGWETFLVIATIVGFIWTLLEIQSRFSRRKDQRAEIRVLELAAAHLEAEDVTERVERARRDASQLEQVRASLLSEVEQRIPLEAKRVYLENRLEQLADTLTSTMREYQAAAREIEAIGVNADPLAAELNASIKTVVDRNLRRRRTLELASLIAIALVLFLLVVPVEPSAYVYDYFATIYFADVQSVPTRVASVVLFTVLTIPAWLAVANIKALAGLRGRVHRRRVVSVGGAIVLALIGVALLVFASWVIGIERENNAYACYWDNYGYYADEGDWCDGDYPAATNDDLRYLVQASLLVGASVAGFFLALAGKRTVKRLRR